MNSKIGDSLLGGLLNNYIKLKEKVTHMGAKKRSLLNESYKAYITTLIIYFYLE